jgi:putative peptidoglycan lipid II flippase
MRATRFAGAVHMWVLAGGAVLTLGMYAVFPLFLPLQAPGFSAERLTAAQHLARLMAPSVFFGGLYALGRSVLNAERRFVAPALAPGLAACVTIAVILAGRQSLGISAAAIGYTAGTAILWLAVYLPIAMNRLPGHELVHDWKNTDALRLLRSAGPLVLGVAAMSAIPVVDRFMASRFPVGVISALSYADRVMQVPVAILVTTVTTAVFPALSQFSARQDLVGIRRTVGAGIQLIAMSLVPVAVLLALLSRDVVAVLFERGQFTASDVQTTAGAVTALAAGLVFVGLFQLVPRVFNAMQLTSLVALSGFMNLGFKTGFNVLLVPTFGYIGFALATSAMYAATGVIMLWLLRQRIKSLDLARILPALGATFVGAVLMAIVGLGAMGLLRASPPLVRLMLTAVTAGAAYAATLWITGGRPTNRAAWRQFHEVV